MKKSKSYYKEMNTHHKDLYITAFKELKFTNLQKSHYKDILDEVKTLLKQWCKNSLIEKVIELWEMRNVLDISIHYDLQCGGINNNKLWKNNI